MDESPPKRSFSGLRHAGTALLATGIIFTIILVGIRFYLSDARLKALVESQATAALGSSLNIGEFEFSVFDGLKLRSIQLGEKNVDPIAIEAQALSIQWQWQKQSWTHLQISDFVIQGLAVYKKPQTQSGDGPSQEEPTTQTKSKTFVLPPIPTQHWPLVIGIESIQVELKKIDIQDPEYQATLEGLMLEASLRLGEGLAQTNLSVHTIKEYTHLAVQSSSKLTLEGAPQLQMKLNTLANDNVELLCEVGLPMAKQSVDLKTKLNFDVSQGALNISEINLALGDHSHLKTKVQAKALYTGPKLETGELNLQLDFDKLLPLMEMFEIPVQLAGKTQVHVQPTSLASLNKDDLTGLTLEAVIESEKVQAQSGVHTLESFDGTLLVNYKDGEFHATSDELILSFRNPQIALQQAQLKIQAKTMLQDWMVPDALGNTHLDLHAEVATVSAAEATVRNIQAHLILDGPTAVLKRQEASEPLQYELDLRTGSIKQGDILLGSVKAESHGSLYDLSAHTLHNQLELTATNLQLPGQEQPITVQELLTSISVRKSGQSIKFEESNLQVDNLADIQISGAINHHSEQSADFTGLKLAGEFHDLQKLLQWAGPNPNFPSKLEGNATLSMTIDGPIALQKLKAEAVVPTLPLLDDIEQWEQEAKPLVDYIGQWMQTLSGELGFEGTLHAELRAQEIIHNAASIKGLEVTSDITTNKKSTFANLDWQTDELGAGVALSKAKGNLFFNIVNQTIELNHSFSSNRFAHESLHAPLKQLTVHQEATYRFGRDLNVARSVIQTEGQNLLIEVDGLIHHPIRTLASGALLQEKLPGVKAQLKGRFKVQSKNQWQILKNAPIVQGQLDLEANIDIAQGAIALQGDMACNKLSIQNPEFILQRLMGQIPMSVVLESYNTQENMSIAHGIALGGGTLYLHTDAAAAEQKSARKVYDEDLRPYRQTAGLEIGYLKFGDYELSNILLDAKIQNGTLSANHFSTELLGGDVLGNLTLKLNAKREFSGLLVLQASNIDASHFSKLNLEPGPDSELSADMRLSLFAAPTQRDINLDVNVTQIGKKTLDRFLQLLDPEEQDTQIQKTRSNLKLINIHAVTAWIRHENLNMDLDYTTRLSIPGTNIGFRPIDRDLLRRYAITEKVIDPYFQSYVDRYLAKSLGWNHEAP